MRTLTYEWRRARSVRTTWVTMFAAVASVSGIGWLVASAGGLAQGERASTTVSNAIQGNPLLIVFVASLGAMAFGHEYRYQTMRTTLTVFPGRTRVFLAKLLITLAFVLVVLALVIGSAYAVVQLSGVSTAPGNDWWAVIWQNGVYLVTVATIALGLTVLTRNHPLGIVGPLLLTVLETAVVAFTSDRFDWVEKVLPITSMTNWLSDTDPLRSAVVLLAWLLALLIGGLVLFNRRDA